MRFEALVGGALLSALCLSARPASSAEAGGGDAADDVARFTVEVALRRTRPEARREADSLALRLGSGVTVEVQDRHGIFAVRAGRFSSLDAAKEQLDRLIDLGYAGASVKPLPRSGGPPRLARVGARSAPDSRTGTGPSTEDVDGRKRIRASRAEDGALKVDGRLDEPIWRTADFVSDFRKKGARRSFPTKERTEVAVLYDDDALYVGARVHSPGWDSIRARRSQRDDAADTDRIIVSLDTLRDRQTAYNFGVTAGGAKIDYYQPEDAFEVRDYTFDPVWQVQTNLYPGGWSAEARIPFSSLRFLGGGDSQVWGINIQRVSPALRLYAFWVVVPGDESGWSSRFGDLVGLRGVRPVRRVAIVPYVAGMGERIGGEPAGGPFPGDDEIEWRYGGDLQLDLSSHLALEATFNPDFGQVEADPAVINLSAYEVFFPEKRPFFLEGAQLFQGLGPRYYYSRRIGAPPHGRVNVPSRWVPLDTTIRGAGKLIGRQPGGLSVGALVAVTDMEFARTYDPGSQEIGREAVEPRTLYGVSRLQKDFGSGSSVGFVGTGVQRQFPSGGALRNLLSERAWAGGVDWNVRFGGQSFVFGGFLGASRVDGDPVAIQRLQGSSARYLQRPDADHVSFDASRTSLEGYTAGLNLGQIEGAWRWALRGELRSPGFEINDLGAMATADDLEASAAMSYHTPGRFGPWERVDIAASIGSGWNLGGVRQYTTPGAQLSLVWNNFWQTYLDVARDLSAFSDSLTRGGPLMEEPAGWRSRFGISTNKARLWELSVDGSYSSDELGGRRYGASVRALARLADRFTFSLTPGYERAIGARQYFTTLAGDRLETFNRRYVFASLDQRTAYARVRVGLALTPRLSLDLYVEPFAALGSYDRFGELEAPRSRSLRLYGEGGTSIDRLEDGSYVVTDRDQTFRIANGDFDVTTLRGNAVLRWDYAQGSSLYLVWAQSRDADDVLGGTIRARDLVDIFDLPPHNVFALKLTFRLNLN